MEDEPKMRDPHACKIAMDLHLAKVNYFMAKKDWKAATIELQHALSAVIEILDNANRTLKRVAEKYQQDRGAIRIEGSIKTEKISYDTILVEYPGDKIVLKKI